jgi:hypothetical protein
MTHPTPDQELEAFFSAVRNQRPEPSVDFISRCATDALEAQTTFLSKKGMAESVSRSSMLTRVYEAVTNIVFQVGGASMAACAGLVIGLQSPDFTDLEATIDSDAQFDLSDLMPNYEIALWEDLDQ